MDDSEKLVAEYLAYRGHTTVVYEPDGNQPPDFLVDGRIAVEVRRLNQTTETPKGPRGLEETRFPLIKSLRKVLASMGPPREGVSWFVFYRFRRPLPEPWKNFERQLRGALLDLVAQGLHNDATVNVGERFRIDVRQASKPHPSLFVLGGSTDRDSGGFVVAELMRNLAICRTEKARKVANVRSRYPEWWLALVDHIGYGGLDASDREQLRSAFRLEDPWAKIILVNPTDATRGFEL